MSPAEAAAVPAIDTAYKEFTPLGDAILIDLIPPGETAGGIALPDDAEGVSVKAKVIAVGPGRTTEFGAFLEVPVKVGDVVYLAPFYQASRPPIKMRFGSKDYAVITARDLFGKVRC